MQNKKPKFETHVLLGQGSSLSEAQKDLETKVKSTKKALGKNFSKIKPEVKYGVAFHTDDKKQDLEKLSIVRADSYEKARDGAAKLFDYEVTAGVKKLVTIEHTYQVPKEVLQKAKTMGTGSPAGGFSKHVSSGDYHFNSPL